MIIGRARPAGDPSREQSADAMRLLDRLPMYAFSGRVAGDAIVMTGVEP